LGTGTVFVGLGLYSSLICIFEAFGSSSPAAPLAPLALC